MMTNKYIFSVLKNGDLNEHICCGPICWVNVNLIYAMSILFGI